jgi:hypothetical protein
MDNTEIEKAVKAAFQTELGQQLEEIYVTSDGKMLIRESEARKHTIGELDPDTQPLEDKAIRIYTREDFDN